jgi:hypothetical protein
MELSDMPDIAQDSNLSAKESATDAERIHELNSLANLLHRWNLLQAVYLQVSSILVAAFLFNRLATFVPRLGEYLWIIGAIVGGLIGLYVVMVIYKPAILLRR